jgi:hypothetical protein
MRNNLFKRIGYKLYWEYTGLSLIIADHGPRPLHAHGLVLRLQYIRVLPFLDQFQLQYAQLVSYHTGDSLVVFVQASSKVVQC